MRVIFEAFGKTRVWLLGAVCMLPACAAGYGQGGELVHVSERDGVTEAVKTFPGKSGDGGQDAMPPTEDMPAHVCPSPFETLSEMPSRPIVISSVRRLEAGMVALNTVNGGSVLVDARDVTAPRVIPVSQQAQVACAARLGTHYYLALIERDAAHAGFRLDVLATATVEALSSAEVWKVRTRGFQPNPGSGCAFVDARQLVVEGMRLRDGKAPYHGIFTVTPESLVRWPDFGVHVPHVVAGDMTHETRHVMFRGVAERESDERGMNDMIYALNPDGGPGELLMSAPHLVFHDHQPRPLDEGACLAMQTGDVCPDDAGRLEHVTWIAPDAAELRFESGRHAFVRTMSAYPEMSDLPPDEVVLADLGKGHYLIASQPDLRQDVGTRLRIGRWIGAVVCDRCVTPTE